MFVKLTTANSIYQSLVYSLTGFLDETLRQTDISCLLSKYILNYKLQKVIVFDYSYLLHL